VQRADGSNNFSRGSYINANAPFSYDYLTNIDSDGTISFTLDGVTHTLTLPSDAVISEGWAAYAIEVYQGEIKIIEIDQETERPV